MKYAVFFEHKSRVYRLQDLSNSPRDADTRVAKLERHGVTNAWWDEVEPWEEWKVGSSKFNSTAVC